jgi:ferrochelatase
MSRFSGNSHFEHGTTESLGILLTNLGTPDAPSAGAIRRYLAEFLWDPRVVEIPRPLWWLILHLFILRFRPSRSAKLYKKIWTASGSPLRITLDEQAQALELKLQERFSGKVYVIPAMRYGSPSIADGLKQLQGVGVRRLLLLPLYPQYSATTTATTFDAVTDILKKWRWQPEFRSINHYADNANYIEAVAASIKHYWEQHGQTEKLVFSFHGLPKQFLLAGDHYHCLCQKSARLIAESLEIPTEQWEISFQSRLGRAEWLTPYTDQIFRELPLQGCKSITVVCPGFSADCLETLEEINIRGRETFMKAGGEIFHYVPALNATESHIDLLVDLVEQHCEGWPESLPDWERPIEHKDAELLKARAIKKGAKA